MIIRIGEEKHDNNDYCRTRLYGGYCRLARV